MALTLNKNNKELSPCINKCCLDTNDICLGCYRSLSEIMGWRDKPDSQKEEILVQCSLRKSLVEKVCK
jgi:predicted Fe-S protein YdhL (DUF1289 family)